MVTFTGTSRWVEEAEMNVGTGEVVTNQKFNQRISWQSKLLLDAALKSTSLYFFPFVF